MQATFSVKWHEIVKIVEDNGYVVVPSYLMQEVSELRDKIEAEKRAEKEAANE